MSAHTHGRFLPLLLLLAACTASAPTVPAAVNERPEAWVWSMAEAGEEACSEDDQCVTLLCSEEACGIYRCEDVPPQPETLAYLWEHAVKLIFRFELTGPIVPFHWRVRPEPAPK